MAEVYYNERGTSRKQAYRFADLLRGDTFNLVQLYVAQSVVGTLTPLVGAGLYQLINLNDGSLLIGPSVTYSIHVLCDAAVVLLSNQHRVDRYARSGVEL